MKKYLMTVMAAVALGGLFTGCNSVDADVNGGNNSAEFNIVQNYENAFITRFGQPAANQTWGFGPAVSGTRGITIGTPYVEYVGPTCNAQLSAMSDKIADALGTGTAFSYFSPRFDAYQSWLGSGWNDVFYNIHGTIEDSNLTDEYLAKATAAILKEIPEQTNNLAKAQSTGYSITTKGGPVTITPIYHNSNSGDKISYYYYPTGSKPTIEQIKELPKYTIGNMADPSVCNDNHTALYRNTYSLVYVNPETDEVSYNFPDGLDINFIITNTWVGNGNLTIYDSGGITTTTGGNAGQLTSQSKFTIDVGKSYSCGEDAYFSSAQIKFSKTASSASFGTTKKGTNVTGSNTTFQYYTDGNGVNGSLEPGATAYYFQPWNTGKVKVAVVLNSGKRFYIKDLGYENWEATSGTALEGFNGITTDSKYYGTYEFNVESRHVYAIYAEGSNLGFYGYEFSGYDSGSGNYYFWGSDALAQDESFTCGDYRQSNQGLLRFGKPQIPVFSPATTDSHVNGYSTYTAGTGNNGNLSGGATAYYIKPYNTGYLRVAVALKTAGQLYIQDLGNEGWNNTNGTSLNGYNGKTVSSDYYGTYDFPVEANHVYAVYASGSQLGFYGCEFLTSSGATEATSSVSDVVTKEIPNNPEYYGDGKLNRAIHASGIDQWKLSGEGSEETPHVAVFQTDDFTFVGFEDWTDLDYNDVIFAVTGTTGGDPIEIPEPEPENNDPEGFVCRIIAEDLTVGENSDFDFNDVVFDVYWIDGATKIRLLAAGGELPLYIGSVDDAHEVHKLFGFPNSYPLINTNWKEGKTTNPVEFTISGTYSNRAACKNIPIYVTKKGENIQLKADQGKVASMVAVGLDYEWCDERTDIDKKFRAKDGTKLFQQYVIGKLGDDWDGNKAWYQYRGKELPNE